MAAIPARVLHAWRRGLLCGLLSGCASPSYDSDARDASVADVGEVSSDAGSPGLDAEVSGAILDGQARGSASADFLRGTYVIRARFYQRDDTGIVHLLHEVVQLGQLAGADDALTLRLTVCRDETTLTAPLTQIEAQVAYPDRWPVREGKVVLDGPKSFHVEAAPLVFGYAAAPPGCSPGVRQPSSAPWLDGSCDCPASDALPVRASDCRVVDSDHDGKPGATIRLARNNETFDYVVTRDSSQIVDGEIAIDQRHRAQYALRPAYFALQCSTNTCDKGTPKDCPQSTAPVEFGPLPDDIDDCGSALRVLDSGGALPATQPMFPSGC